MQAVAGVPEPARHVRAWQQEFVLGSFWHGATAHGLMAAPASAIWAYGALQCFFYKVAYYTESITLLVLYILCCMVLCCSKVYDIVFSR
jgi:hypothetical protein